MNGDQFFPCPWCREGTLLLNEAELRTGHTAPMCEGYQNFVACAPGKPTTEVIVRTIPTTGN